MTNFMDRQRELFNQLKAAEKQALYVVTSDGPDKGKFVVIDKLHSRERSKMKQFRGRESIFKRPEAPLAQCLPPRTLPGYLKNPNKWTCYNLEDVPDVSERSNAEAVAMCRRDILKDAESRNDDEMESSDSKLVYKPQILNSENEHPSKSVEYKNSIVIYPEYFVGQKHKAKKAKTDKANDSKKPAKPVLKLDHLEEDDDLED